jgi:hypothetical protein
MTKRLEPSMIVVPTAISEGARLILSIQHLRSAVETLVADELPQASRQRLVCFVLGVLLAGSIVLRCVATTQFHIAPCTAQAASHEHRLRRSLNDPHLRRYERHGRLAGMAGVRAERERLIVSIGHLAAFSDSVDYDIPTVGSLRGALFGGGASS